MRKQINFIFNNLKIFNMGEKDEKDKPNAHGFVDRFRNAVLGATMADQPAVMTASGWRQNEKGDYVLDKQNDSNVLQLRDNLAVIAGTADGNAGIDFGMETIQGAISNNKIAKLISKHLDKTSPKIKEMPLNVGWGPKQTIKVTHATDSQEPLQLFFDKRWDVTHEGANPFGVWYLGKWGLPRTAATNSLPGKAEKAARARKVFEDRKYKLTGEVTLDKPLTTVGEVPNRSTLSYDAEKMGADGIIYNNVYDNGYDNNQVILSHKLHVPSNKKGSKIHIKKKNRGKFTEYCGGEVTDRCIEKAKKSKNPTLRKRATFAENARGWSKKHLEGGLLEAGMSFIPIVGTYLSYQDFKKDPTMANLGWTIASGIGDALLLTGLGYGIGSAIKGLKAANAARKSVQAVNNVRRATRMANQAKMLEYGETGKRGFQGWKAAGVNLRNSDKKLEAATLVLKGEALQQAKNAGNGFATAVSDPVDWAETIYKNNNEL